jgi:protein phosphatase
MSDNLYNTLNNEGSIQFGATLCGVWLIDGHAVFINLGDSRGYRLGFYKKNIKQITIDHNIASYLVASGELTPAQARRHPSRAQLTRFVGMDSPAEPEVTVIPVQRGDYLLLCSDGVYGMLPDICLPELLRSSKSPERVVENITQAANTEGGKDNIAVVYLKILG